MNSKISTYVLGILLTGALIFAFYTRDQAAKHEAEKAEWQSKYEEALIDAEESGQHNEEKIEVLEKELNDCKQAGEALAQPQKKK